MEMCIFHIDLRTSFRNYIVFMLMVGGTLICSDHALGQTRPLKSAWHQTIDRQRECLKAAQGVLGPRVKLLKCGELNQSDMLESIAVVLITPKSHSVRGLFARDLVILNQKHGEWIIALRASRLMKNEAGYIGLDYIDDWSPFWADQIEFSGRRPDGKEGLVISIQWRAFENDTDPLPTDIAWDSAVGRYREITADGFQSEMKNPQHKCPGGGSKGAR